MIGLERELIRGYFPSYSAFAFMAGATKPEANSCLASTTSTAAAPAATAHA